MYFRILSIKTLTLKRVNGKINKPNLGSSLDNVTFWYQYNKCPEKSGTWLDSGGPVLDLGLVVLLGE